MKTDLKFWNAPDFKRQVELIAGQVPWETAEAHAPLHRKAIETPTIKHQLDEQEHPIVLEIGCGVGRLLKVFQEDREVIGVDFSPNMIEKGKEYVPRASLYVTDGSKLPVPENYVDLVYSFLVFQHIQSEEEIKTYLKEALRVLRPGGFIRVQTHKGTAKPNGQWVGRFFKDIEEFASVFKEAGFYIVEKDEGLLHTDWLWVTAQKPL